MGGVILEKCEARSGGKTEGKESCLKTVSIVYAREDARSELRGKKNGTSVKSNKQTSFLDIAE